VRYDVLTAMIMKSAIFWKFTPLSLEEVYRRFGGLHYLYLHGQRVLARSKFLAIMNGG
jgi:hypothetical protein